VARAEENIIARNAGPKNNLTVAGFKPMRRGSTVEHVSNHTTKELLIKDLIIVSHV
jgi:hypothetical protein